LAFKKSHETTLEIDGEEQEALKDEESTNPSCTGVHPSDHEESEESTNPVNPPSDEDTRTRWLQDTLRDAKRHAAPKGTFKESRPP
jgi:hypothetical protein